VLQEMYKMVDRAVSILSGQGAINEFGALLHEAWKLKRSVSDKVSNITIDRIYDTAMANGAIGGKLLGAGSSGFMLIFASPENQILIKEAMPMYLYVPFKFDNTGSTIIYYER